MEEEKKNFKKNFYDKNDSGLAFLFANILPIAISFVFLFFIMMLRKNTDGLSGEVWYIIISAIISNASLVLCVVATNFIGQKTFSSTKVKFKINWKIIFICVLVALVCYFGFVNFIDAVDFGFEKLGFSSANINLPLTNFGWLLVYLVLFALLPAICEELIFRGVVFNGLRKNFSDGFAVFFSALLFALMHASVMQLVYPFIMGVVFAFIVLRTGNVLYSMIVHILNNAIVVLFGYLEINYGFSMMLGKDFVGILISILIAVVAFVVLFLIDKLYFKNKNDSSMNEEKQKSGGLGVCMIIGIALCILSYFINILTTFIN